MLPVNSSIYSTRHVVEQIASLNLLVNVAFLGENLQKTVEYLETKSKSVQSGQRSYLIYHYTPSRYKRKPFIRG